MINMSRTRLNNPLPLVILLGAVFAAQIVTAC